MCRISLYVNAIHLSLEVLWRSLQTTSGETWLLCCKWWWQTFCCHMAGLHTYSEVLYSCRKDKGATCVVFIFVALSSGIPKSGSLFWLNLFIICIMFYLFFYFKVHLLFLKYCVKIQPFDYKHKTRIIKLKKVRCYFHVCNSQTITHHFLGNKRAHNSLQSQWHHSFWKLLGTPLAWYPFCISTWCNMDLCRQIQ